MGTRALAIVLAVVGAAAASDHPESARKLTLRDVGTSRSLGWSVRFPLPVLPATSPVVTGATLHVFSASGESASFDLPASGWVGNATGTAFTFKNGAAPGGPTPVRVASLKALRAIKVSVKTSGLTLDEPAQGAVGIELTIGSDVYCAECTAPTRDVPGRFAAKLCRPPVACTGVVVTTTSTTTSTFVPGRCGNDLVDQPSEQCDGTDPGLCDDIPIPFQIGCQSPGQAEECQCCGIDRCAGGINFRLDCCAPLQCQDTTGVGSERTGVCLPPTCTQDADCQGYRCVGGTCCGNAGQICGVAGCCPDTGTTCELTQAFVPLCCKTAGNPCTNYTECCNLSCTSGTCD